MLVRGRDYLFFDNVDCTHDAEGNTTLTRGAALMTPDSITLVPWQPSADSIRSVRALLGNPELDVTKLESSLRVMFASPRPRLLFPIARLATFKVTSGFFGMITLAMPGEPVHRLVVRDRGGKLLAKEFFTARSGRFAATG